MKPEIDIHQFDRHYAVALESLKREPRLTEQNKSTINRFLEMLESEGLRPIKPLNNDVSEVFVVPISHTTTDLPGRIKASDSQRAAKS